MNDKRTKVEFIESYWKDGNTDYIWNDNHGELIRCKDCKYFMPKTNACTMGSLMCPDESDYCSRGVRK